MNLAIDIIFLILAVWFEKAYHVRLFGSIKERIIVTLVIFVILISWELINYNYFQAWLYPGPGMIGINILGLPIELFLFFLTAPYFSLIVYELIHKNVDSAN